MKTAYVTGATGCVGRNLIDELVQGGWNIVVAHRASSDLSRLSGLPVGFREVDLHDPASVLDSLPDQVNAVFHVAGNTSHWSAESKTQWKDNVLATRNLVRAALEKKAQRFLFTSTGATWKYQGTDPILASAIRSSYVRTKRLGEIEIERGMAQGLDMVVLHPIIVVGAYDYNCYSEFFNVMNKSGAAIVFPGRIVFCHAKDVARSHVLAYEKGRCGEHYLLDGTYATWLDFVQAVADTLQRKLPARTTPSALLSLMARFMTLTANVTRRKPLLTPELLALIEDAPDIPFCEKRKNREHLGWRPSENLQSMVEDCRKWLKRENRLDAKAQGGLLRSVFSRDS